MEIILIGMILAVVLMVAVLVVDLIYLILLEIYPKTLRYKTFYSNVTVRKKEYKEEYTTYFLIGKVMVPHTYDEEYDVYLMYKGKLYCIDSKELYKKVKVGDTVRAKVHKGYNRRNKVKYVYLSI